MQQGDIFEQITHQYNRMTKIERKIADYVLKDRKIMQPVTSQQIAE